MKKSENQSLNISIRSFITAIVVIAVLMAASYVITLILPAGMFERSIDEAGNTVINTNRIFTFIEGGIPFWKWLLSPILVLTADGGGALIAVIAFLLVIGGVFSNLEKCGLMKYMLDKTVVRFGKVRYRLMAIIVFFFMAMGAMIGSFEECVPLVPIVVALCLNLGWDSTLGVGMSLLAVGCGFASGVFNPFTVGVAQQLCGLPMFSGAWMRLLSFALIYLLLMLFLCIYAKKTEKTTAHTNETTEFVTDPKMDRALVVFVSVLGLGIAIILASGFIPALQDLTMIIVAVTFLVAGIWATALSGMKGNTMLKTFLGGVCGVLPAVIMILMASSIKYTLEEAQVLDTILYGAVKIAGHLPGWSIILFIYAIVLGMNFFIPSGSAKAFMLIPLIVPLAQMFGVSPQLCIVAFAFGDGFSNVLYPTNPALLISLGLADVSYGKWFKWSFKFQLANLILTSSLLLFGYFIGY